MEIPEDLSKSLIFRAQKDFGTKCKNLIRFAWMLHLQELNCKLRKVMQIRVWRFHQNMVLLILMVVELFEKFIVKSICQSYQYLGCMNQLFYQIILRDGKLTVWCDSL